MSNEKAIRMVAPEEPGLSLLKGKISGMADLGTVNGIRKVLFNVGSYTSKAYGATADMIKEKQGQIVELRGKWERLRKDPQKEEFVVKGFYTGKAFQTLAYNQVPTSVSTSKPTPNESDKSHLAVGTSPSRPSKVALAPKKESIEEGLSLATKGLIHTMRGVTTVEELQEITANPTKYGIFKCEAAKILLDEIASKEIIAPVLEMAVQD